MVERNTATLNSRLSTRLSKQGSHLLHAQCWAWGRDIKHAEGNLLLRYGFERQRPPAGLSGCTQYTFRKVNLTIRVWGFGVYIGDAEGIYLNRYEFVPRKAFLADVWTPASFARRPRSFDLSLLIAFLEWVSSYEVWIEEAHGRAYRDAVLRDFSVQSDEPMDLAVEWLCLKEAIAKVACIPEVAHPRAQLTFQSVLHCT